MQCCLCKKLGPKYPWALLEAPWPDVCHVLNPQDPWLRLKTTYSELVEAAKSGCLFCSVIRDGIRGLANSDDVTSIELAQFLEVMRGDKLGQQSSFSVELTHHANTRTRLEFYTDDSQSARLPQFSIRSDVIS